MSASTRKPTKRVFYPPRSFDDDLECFVQLARAEGWHFSGVDFESLARDLVDQSSERDELNAAEGRFRALQEGFGCAQQARYRRFAAALNAARAAFQRDPNVMSRLKRFKRSTVKQPRLATRRAA